MQKDRYNVGARITSRSTCVLPVTITRATLLFISFKFNLRINAIIAYFPVFLIYREEVIQHACSLILFFLYVCGGLASVALFVAVSFGARGAIGMG